MIIHFDTRTWLEILSLFDNRCILLWLRDWIRDKLPANVTNMIPYCWTKLCTNSDKHLMQTTGIMIFFLQIFSPIFTFYISLLLWQETMGSKIQLLFLSKKSGCKYNCFPYARASKNKQTSWEPNNLWFFIINLKLEANVWSIFCC
jgi:hypothetical protein